MATLSGRLFLLAGLVTVGALAGWRATGGDYYTKYRFQETVTIDPDSPEAALGETETQVWKDGLRMGLLPTDGPWDKHFVSVAGLTGPAWGLWLAVWLVERRRKPATPGSPGAS